MESYEYDCSSVINDTLSKASDNDIQVKEYTQILYAVDMAISYIVVYMLTVTDKETGIEYGLGEYKDEKQAEKARQKILIARKLQ